MLAFSPRRRCARRMVRRVVQGCAASRHPSRFSLVRLWVLLTPRAQDAAEILLALFASVLRSLAKAIEVAADESATRGVSPPGAARRAAHNNRTTTRTATGKKHRYDNKIVTPARRLRRRSSFREARHAV